MAVKAFRLDLVPEDAARLAAALRRLAAQPVRHPAVVPMLEAGLEGAIPFVAMEYASGEALDVVLREQAPLPLDRARRVLAPVAQALDAAAAAGLAHGALHPRDIFLTTGSWDVRVTGLGVVGALESIGVRPPMRRPYTAPERLAGRAWDRRADVYSLGVIAYEMLTGRRPVGAPEPGAAWSPTVPAELLEDIGRVLAAAMAERPEDRFETAEAVVAALKAVADGLHPRLPGAETPVAVAPPAPPAEPDQTASERTAMAAPAPPAVAAPPATAPPSIPAAAATLPEPAPVRPATPPAAAPKVARPPRNPADVTLRHRPMPRTAGSVVVSQPVPTAPSPAMVPPPQPYPWAAIIAVAVAGLVVGGVIGYLIGQRNPAVPRPLALATAPAAADTEVPVGAEPQAQTPPPDASVRPAETTEAAALLASRVARASAPIGRLVVTSQPSGALVTVDGQRVGDTPLELADVPLGQHTVLVARPGFVPRTERVTLTAAAPSRALVVELRPGLDLAEPRFGAIYVDSRPRGARVSVNGRFAGTTPVRIPELTGGQHAVTIELAGHQPIATKVQVRPGEQSRLAVTLVQGDRDDRFDRR